MLGDNVAGAQDVTKQILLHLVVEGEKTGQRQITGGVVEAVEKSQLLSAMSRIVRRVPIDGDSPHPLLATFVTGDYRVRKCFGQAQQVPGPGRVLEPSVGCDANDPPATGSRPASSFITGSSASRAASLPSA